MTQVIGITGLKRHGKGEAGAAVTRLVPGAVALGFADKLKISMMRALGFDRSEADLIALADSLKVTSRIAVEYHEPDELDLPEFPRLHDFSGRELLQWYGTEGGRNTFGKNFWIDLVLPDPAAILQGGVEEQVEHQLEQRYPGVPALAITDIRFDNEAQRVKDVGGVVWEIVNPALVDSSEDTHASEAGIDPALVDTVIVNDGTLENLQWRVEQALELAGVIQPS